MENKVTKYEKPKKEFSVGNIREKELIRAYRVIDLSGEVNSDGEADAVLDCRLYTGRSSSSSVKYAIIWTEKGDGTGSAGGCGYDKDSVAVGEAVAAIGHHRHRLVQDA